MKRLMIINWRWKKFDDNSNQEIDLHNEVCLFISKYKTDNIEEFNEFISNVIKQKKPNEALILSHNNSASSISIAAEAITLIEKDDFLMKRREFGGGRDYIYYGDENPKGMIDTNEKLLTYNVQLKKENFEFVWDWYWNKLDLEYQKKNLINLWLPLAIDIQGLREVQKDEKKAKEYYKEIREELINNDNETEYCKSLKLFPKFKIDDIEEDLPEWDEINGELNNGYNTFNPLDLVNEILKKHSFNDFDKKYFSDPNFLPNWLQEVVKVIDEKLKQNS